MKKQELEFRFEGKQAEADAQALAGFLAQEFPDWPARVSPSQPPPNPPGTRDAATTIVIIALIVALPSGIKDGLELADRLKPKIDRLIAWAKERRARRQRNPFIALPPHGTSLPLDQVKPEQLLAAVAAQAPKPPQKSLSS
jgi:hypothetical protein